MRTFRAELHVHTVLSPCAEIEMLPPLIVAEALERDIQVIAITDHNTSGNVQAVMQTAESTGLTVLPGMEVQTREEVHSLCLFDSLEQAYVWQEIVRKKLPGLKNRADYFGDQLLVDQNGDFVAREEQLLLTSADISLEDAWRTVNQLGGLFIPAHVDRKANGLIPLLGIVPPDIPWEALEISRHIKPDQSTQVLPQVNGYPLIQDGDAHRLDEITGANLFSLEAPTIAEIRLAIRQAEGRSHRLLSQTRFQAA